MRMNGHVGRTRRMARIICRRKQEAARAGIDPNDRDAVERFHYEKMCDLLGIAIEKSKRSE